MRPYKLKLRPIKGIKKLARRYAGLKLIPKIGVTILIAAIIGGLVGGIVIYNIKSKPVSFNQSRSTTQTTTPQTIKQSTKSVSSSTTSSNQNSSTSQQQNPSDTSNSKTSLTFPSVPVVNVPTLQQICAQGASEAAYTYNTSVDHLASDLATDEDNAFNEFENYGFSEVVNLDNEDINTTNTTISSDWTSSFETNVPSDCTSYPYSSSAPPLLLVPACEAEDFSGLPNCIDQIDSSLDITG